MSLYIKRNHLLLGKRKDVPVDYINTIERNGEATTVFTAVGIAIFLKALNITADHSWISVSVDYKH